MDHQWDAIFTGQALSQRKQHLGPSKWHLLIESALCPLCYIWWAKQKQWERDSPTNSCTFKSHEPKIMPCWYSFSKKLILKLRKNIKKWKKNCTTLRIQMIENLQRCSTSFFNILNASFKKVKIASSFSKIEGSW